MPESASPCGRLGASYEAFRAGGLHRTALSSETRVAAAQEADGGNVG
jgi:hypothetical protein